MKVSPVVRTGLFAALCGLVGMGLFTIAWHAYVDHQQLHGLFALVQQAQQAQAQQAQTQARQQGPSGPQQSTAP